MSWWTTPSPDVCDGVGGVVEVVGAWATRAGSLCARHTGSVERSTVPATAKRNTRRPPCPICDSFWGKTTTTATSPRLAELARADAFLRRGEVTERCPGRCLRTAWTRRR